MIKPALPRQFALDLSRSHQATLENFLPGSDSALLSALRSLVKEWSAPSYKENPSTPENPLNHRWIYWWGEPGSGRSHLLQALVHSAELASLQNYYLASNEPVSWVKLEADLPALLHATRPTVIAVDDVDRLDERLCGALFRIMNMVRESSHLHIFMTGNDAPANLKLREDVRTRLAWGLVFQTQVLGDHEKIQALEQAATERGLVLSPDVLPWLLNRFYRDMPNLMALLDALDAYSLETKRAVTLPLVRELLQGTGHSTT
ncbi:MAG: DnaA regulatory inactivator Hda [Polynucleobacter sp.]|nr:DnaA regulatory inactivator Hda [Polynucleobacter sp.]